MRRNLLISTFLVFFSVTAFAASTEEILLNLSSDQPALYDFLNKSFVFTADPKASKEIKTTIVDPNDPAKGIRYQVHLNAQRKGDDDTNILFEITLNYIEIGYDKRGEPAFPPQSVRSVPRIESVTIAQSKEKNG